MRVLMRFRTYRLVSLICILALIVPLGLNILTPTPASAQSQTLRIAVITLRNTSKYADEMYASTATDALAVELMRSGKFDPTRADALDSKLEELGYKNKEDRGPNALLRPSDLQRIGQEVGADWVATGEIQSIKIAKDSKKAEVKLTVRVLDAQSGEWVNGATATGLSESRIGYSNTRESEWVIEAVNNAAAKAVSTIVSYTIPEATIIATITPTEVLLNKGTANGIQSGMKMIVVRRVGIADSSHEEVVGRIRITQVSDTDAHATVDNAPQGVRPEDRVRAIYDPDQLADNTGRRSTEAKTHMANASKWIWGVAALVGLIALFNHGGSGAGDQESVSGAVYAGNSPDVIDYYGGDGGIALCWNNPTPLGNEQILQFHVWRDNMGSQINGGGTATNVGPCAAPDFSTAPGMTVPGYGQYLHSSIDNVGNWAPITYSYPSQDHNTLASVSATVPGLTVGATHNYYISCLYQRANITDPNLAIQYFETPASYLGRATYITRPVATGPTYTQSIPLSDVTFTWQGSTGANQYVIEVSSDPNFSRNKTWVNQIFNKVVTDGTMCSQEYVNVLNHAAELAGVTVGQTLYWRVGGRNSADSPGPFPVGGANAVSDMSNPKCTRYMYSNNLNGNGSGMFLVGSTVPAPPATSTSVKSTSVKK